MPPLPPPSTLYTNCTIITVNAKREVILNGAIHVMGNRIAAIATSSTGLPSLPFGTRIVDLGAKIVIPGLINAHAHVVQSLMRGLAEDMDLFSWACDAIWPLEVNYDGADGYTAARLTMAEMLKSGTTCFLEPMLSSYAGFANVAKAVDEMGIRACIGNLVKAPKSNSRAGDSFMDARDKSAANMSIQATLTNHRIFHGTLNNRLHVWMAAETPRGIDEAFYAEIGKVCDEQNMRFTVHVAETARDKQHIRENYATTPGQFCERTKLAGDHTVLAHMIHLHLDTDLEILQSTKTSVVHNPTSNCKLADGIAPIPQMLAKGINVALGTDGAPCSNTYDLFRDMHLAGIIHKGVTQDASLLPSEQVLEMATINGAKALGLEKEIGSLEVGKTADFVVVNPGGLHAAPYDRQQLGMGGASPVATVVHSCGGSDVDMVVVDGVVLVRDGTLLYVDENDIKQKAREAVLQIRARSNIIAQPLKMGWKYVY